jgi:hypothetical protein
VCLGKIRLSKQSFFFDKLRERAMPDLQFLEGNLTGAANCCALRNAPWSSVLALELKTQMISTIGIISSFR